jgi:hypothetical protein
MRDRTRAAVQGRCMASQDSHIGSSYRKCDVVAIGPAQEKGPEAGPLLRERDSNARPSGYEPDELPLLHPARFILTRREAQRAPKKSSIQREIRLARPPSECVALADEVPRSTAIKPSPCLTKS